jgi:hypothetical protein
MRNHSVINSSRELRRPTEARIDPDGSQVVDITVDHGYRPQSIVALAGAPLKLVFRRRDDEACSERVVFSSPRVDRRLAPWADTTIMLPPQVPGMVRFTCAMGRYRGQIELTGEARPRPPISARLRVEAFRLERPIGTAFVLWLGSLPLIALAGVLLLRPGAVVFVALIALLAWIAACLWSFGDSRGTA